MTDAVTTALVVPTDDPVIVGYRDRAAALKTEADTFVVDSPETRAAAVEILSAIARLKTGAEDKRVALVRPHNDHVKAVNDLFKSTLAPILEADTILRKKVTDYNRDEERKKQEAAAEAERQKLAAQARLDSAAKAEAAGDKAGAAQLLDQAVQSEAAAVEAQQLAASAAPARVVKTDIGSASVRRRWTFELEDLGKVPVEYLQLNDIEVRKAIAGGLRPAPDGTQPIPGVRIFETDGLTVRK